MSKIILIGAGTHAISVIDSLNSISKLEIAGLIDNNPILQGDIIMGYRVLGNCEKLSEIRESGVPYAFVSVGGITNSVERELLYDSAQRAGFRVPIIIDPSATFSSDASFDVGVYVGKRASIGALASISRLVIIGTGAIIEPKCDIASFAHIEAGAVLGAGSTIGSGTTIGAGAVIVKGVEIGSNCIITPGSVVTFNVEDNARVAGNPGKRIS